MALLGFNVPPAMQEALNKQAAEQGEIAPAYVGAWAPKEERPSMTTQLARTEPAQLATVNDPVLADTELWDIVSSGDLKGLSPKQRSDYYLFRCRQEGLNPASQPFTYLVLNGKGVLYGNKTAADQLRKVHGISIVDLKFFDDGEYLTYEITMQDRDGRRDIDVGQVFVGTAKGEQRANARMKAITKAKRRATYSICGTGVLDETEVETMMAASASTPERVSAEVVDQATGEITDAGITREQSRRLAELMRGLGWHIAQMREFSKHVIGKENSNELTAGEADELIAALEAAQDDVLQPA